MVCDCSTLLTAIAEKTGIEPAEQLLLCVRQAGYGQQGGGGGANLAASEGLVAILTESGALADDSELTVERKPDGWFAGGNVVSLAQRVKADRERVDVIRVICSDSGLTELEFDDHVLMPKGTATVSDLKGRVWERLMQVGCMCQSTGQCMLCNQEFRLRRLVNDYGSSHDFVDAALTTAFDTTREVLLNDADLYTGCAVPTPAYESRDPTVRGGPGDTAKHQPTFECMFSGAGASGAWRSSGVHTQALHPNNPHLT